MTLQLTNTTSPSKTSLFAKTVLTGFLAVSLSVVGLSNASAVDPTDATLSLTSTVKGQALTSLGTPNAGLQMFLWPLALDYPLTSPPLQRLRGWR